MSIIKRFLSFFIVCLMQIQIAHAALEIVITEGTNSARPVAVVPFKWLGVQPKPKDMTDFARVIADDLRNSGRFSPLERSLMPQTPATETAVDYAAWKETGVEAIVIGTIKPLQDGRLQIHFQLINVLSGFKNQTPQKIDEQLVLNDDHIKLNLKGNFSTRRPRHISHRLSDYIFENLTGTRGAFLTRIAYVAINYDDKYPFKLLISDYDGMNQHILFRSTEPVMSPSWDPTGKKLAYMSMEDKKHEIWIYDLVTQKRELIEPYKGSNILPVFSPDGSKLSMILSKSGQADVYVYDLKTKKLDRLTKNRGIDTEATWAPDGKSIVFASERGGRPQIYQINLESKKIKRLTFEGNANLNPSISPDGKNLVMVSLQKGKYSVTKQDLSDGYVQKLTNGRLDKSPSIAPNGSMVIYSTVVKGKQVLSLVSMDGRFKAVLPASDGEVKAPAWSPFLTSKKN